MGNDESAHRTLFEIKLKVYGKYLHEPVNQYVIRFHPWRKWLLLCKETFNFENDLLNDVQMEQFDQLLDCSAGPNPLLENEKARLRAEYSTLVKNVIKASDILKCDKVKYTQTDLWYLLLIHEKFYVYCKYFITFAVKFLNRSFNEAIVESELSSLEDVEVRKHPLDHKTSVKLNFISTNCRHPLVSLPCTFQKRLALYTFKYKWFVSKVVNRHYEAKNHTNLLV